MNLYEATNKYLEEVTSDLPSWMADVPGETDDELESRRSRPAFRRKYGDVSDIKHDVNQPTYMRSKDSLEGKVLDTVNLTLVLDDEPYRGGKYFINKSNLKKIIKELNTTIPNKGVKIKSSGIHFVVVVNGIPKIGDGVQMVMDIFRKYYDKVRLINKYDTPDFTEY